MEEDQKKVDAILESLNKSKKGLWVAAEGFHTTTSVEFSGGIDGKSPVFNPASGIIVKNFVNTETGEVRPYFYKKVVKSDE